MLLNQKTEHYLKNIGLIKLKMNQRFKDLQQENYIILDELNIYIKIDVIMYTNLSIVYIKISNFISYYRL